ncbi:DUF5916 domain-containing protein [candidate division KSB1 bacterium]
MSGKLYFLLISFFVLISKIGFSQEITKSVTAVRTSTPQIDGVFHDYEWQKGGMATGFTQFNPDEGEPASQKTEVYFLYDDENIYIGVYCYDEEPDKIVRRIGSRDQIEDTDYISVYLDPFHDHRDAFQFAVNAAGTQDDGRYFNDMNYDNSWDGVWWAKTGMIKNGWIAEIKIPFSTLKFPEKNVHTWGLNLRRVITRNNELSFWQEANRDNMWRVSKYGHLEGLESIKTGLNLEILPYVTSRVHDDRISSLKMQNDNGITGVDVKYGVTSNLTATLTINPDFAQIEADEDLINLSRYPLYLPEKRPFFTEGLNVFRTARSQFHGGLFYTRRINEPVYGLKINGKVGNWDVGVLHSMNDNDAGINAKIENEDIPESTKNEAFYNVIRLSRDIFSRSKIGFITMSKEYSGNYNRIFGLDGSMIFKSNFILAFEAVKSFTSDVNEKNHMIDAGFNRQSDIFSFGLNYQEHAPNFVGNDIGFYSYNDFRFANAWVDFGPRIESIGIRQLRFMTGVQGENFWAADFFDKKRMSRSWSNNFYIQFMNYWRISGGKNSGKYYDRFDNLLYPTDSFSLGFSNNYNSPYFFNFQHAQGKYRTGYSWSYNSMFRIKPNDRINVQISYNKSLAKLVNTETNNLDKSYYEVWRTKFYYHFNPDLHARVIFQYSDMDKRLNTYYLLAYNFRPKSFLYLAYTERFDESPYVNRFGEEIIPRFGSSNKVLQLKLSYLWLK